MIRTLIVAFGIVTCTVPAGGQTPLSQIPANAPVVIAMHGVKRTSDRCLALLKSGLPAQAKEIQALVDDFTKKNLTGNRQLQGLKDDGPVFLVLRSLPKPDRLTAPSLGLIARVTDYKAFRDGLLTPEERKSIAEDKTNGWESAALATGQIFFISRSDYAVVCFNAAAAAEFAKKEQGQGFAATLPPPLAQKMLHSDLAVYIDVAAVTKEYDPIVKAGKAALGGLLNPGGEESGRLDKGQAEMIRGIATSILQIADDCTYLFLSCDFNPDGLALHVSAGLAEASKTNQALKAMKPTPLAGLQGLPAGFTTYTAVDFGTEAYKAFHPLVRNLLAASGERGDQVSEKAVDDALVDVVDAKPRRVFSAAKMGAGRAGLQVWEFADADKGTAAQLRMFKALKEGATYQLIPLKSKAVVKADAQAYKDGKLHRVVLKWDLDKLADALLGSEDSSGLLRKFSGDGTTLWFGKVGKQSVQVSAKDWKTAGDLLDKYVKKEETIGADKAFLAARGHLPKEATVVSMIHVPQYGQYFAEVLYEAIRAQGVKGLKAPTAPEAKAADSYLGMAVTLQNGAVSLDLWVPVAAARELSRIIEPALKKAGEK